MKLRMFLCSCLLVCFAVLVLAQDTTGTMNMRKTTKAQTRKDKTMTNMHAETMKSSSFVMEAASGGMMEVKLGHIAKEKASSPDVKSFGEMMIKDHSAANSELKTIARKNDIKLPTKVTKDEQEMIDKLSKLSGTDFDKEYVSMMVKDHKEDIDKFEDAAKTESNADVKKWAQKTLPTLRQHLSKIQEIERSMDSVSRGNSK